MIQYRGGRLLLPPFSPGRPIHIVIDHYKGKNKGKRARPNQIGYIAAAELARDAEIIAKLRAAGRLK